MSIFNLFKKKPAPVPVKPQPIVIRDPLGDFTRYNPETDDRFEGRITWLGETVEITLYLDKEESASPDKALAHLRQLMAQAEQWDTRLRQAGLQDIAEPDGTVDIWGDGMKEEPSTISSEEFLRRISLAFLWIYPDGSLYFDYDLDQMFTDHGLGFDANISGEIIPCGLQG